MATKIKASIKLAPGQVGFYDERTGLHLTLAKTTEDVYENMNIYGIKQAVKQGRIIVTSGSLEDEKTENVAPLEEKKVIKKAKEVEIEKVEIVKPVEAVEAVEQELIQEEILIEENQEVAIEKIQEEKPKKKTAKKSSSKKED